MRNKLLCNKTFYYYDCQWKEYVEFLQRGKNSFIETDW